MTPRDVPHAVWRAVDCIPRPRGPYGECTCGECVDARAQEANADAVHVIAEGLRETGAGR